VTKQMYIGHAVFTAKQLKVSTVSTVSLKTKLKGGLFDRSSGGGLRAEGEYAPRRAPPERGAPKVGAVVFCDKKYKKLCELC